MNQGNKHVDIKLHFLRNMVKQGKIEVTYCPTESMATDPIRKDLDGVKHQKHIVMIGFNFRC